MFSAQFIFYNFVIMFFIVFIIDRISKYPRFSLLTHSIGFLSSLIVLISGFELAIGWQNPFSNVDSTKLLEVGVTHGGKSGLVILAISLWPYVLILFGGLFSYMNFNFIRILLKSSQMKTFSPER